jgi:Predicted metal binding domain
VLASAAEMTLRLPEAEDEIIVDPAVARRKFERELETYGAMASDRRKLGWWILSADFPEVLVAFAHPRLKPPSVIVGAVLDFTNYDVWAPSVTLVNPFTKEPYRARDLPAALTFSRRVNVELPAQFAGFGQGQAEQPLLVAHSPDDIPFLCIPGVREYHSHPAHSGDSWFLHRGLGEGTLYFLLEKLYRYGVEPITDYQYGLHIVGYTRPLSPD